MLAGGRGWERKAKSARNAFMEHRRFIVNLCSKVVLIKEIDDWGNNLEIIWLREVWIHETGTEKNE